MEKTKKPSRYISRRPAVIKQTGLSPSTLRRLEQQGIFPAAVILGPNSVGYFQDEVDAYLNSLPRGHAEAPEPANKARRNNQKALARCNPAQAANKARRNNS